MQHQLQAAQGDLLIEQVTEKQAQAALKNAKRIPSDAEGRIVLATSEVRGHEHCFIDPRVVVWQLDTPTRQMLVEVKEASEEHPVLLLGGTREVQRARLQGAPVGDAALPGEGHFPVRLTQKGWYHVPQQVAPDLLGALRQVTD